MADVDAPRHDWSLAQVEALYALPFMDLLYRAQRVHRAWHAPNTVQMSTLLSIKTGGCPEDCAYCPQSARYHTGVAREALMDVAAVRECAARELAAVAEMIRAVRALGLETCATLGMLTPAQAGQLKDAGLDYYNHNLDTSPEFYAEIITTRDYQDRLDTLAAVREAGLKVCCGGIIGMGESLEDRARLLCTLANLAEHPESVPINRLVRVPGTPLEQAPDVDPFDFVRTIAVARVLMPRAKVRLSAGRETMSDELQALCLIAGANSIFYGEKLLTTGNPDVERDRRLLERLKVAAEPAPEAPADSAQPHSGATAAPGHEASRARA